MRRISRKGIICIVSTAFALAVLLTVWLFMKSARVNSPTALIYSDGELLYEIRLDTVMNEYTIEIPHGNSSNTVLVGHGRISVCEADCPDKVCVNTGAITDGIIPILCLPNRLEIRIVNGGSKIDAVAQ